LGVFRWVHLIERADPMNGVRNMKNSPWIRRAAALGCSIVLLACQPPAGELTFEEAWVRAMPPGMKMTSAYGVFRNGTGDAVTLEAFASPMFGDVSLHETRQVNGVSKMVEVGNLTLQPGEALGLEPGGYHLMLMAPSAPLAIGAVVPIELTAADGRTFRFELPVERR